MLKWIVSHTNVVGRDKGHTVLYTLEIELIEDVVVVYNTTDNNFWARFPKDTWEADLTRLNKNMGCVFIGQEGELAHPTTFYQFALRNAATYLRNTPEAQGLSGESLTAFQITEALAIVFCKAKEEIMVDLLKVQGVLKS